MITSKYQDALPLYRQAALLGRFGGELSRNTLAGSLVRVGAAVQPIVNLLRDTLLDADLIHGDETELQVLKEPGRAAQRKSYLWAQMSGSGPTESIRRCWREFHHPPSVPTGDRGNTA